MDERVEPAATGPEAVYQHRLTDRRAALTETEAKSGRFWFARRVSFLAIPVGIALAYEGIWSGWWLLLLFVVFVGLIIGHQRIHRREARLKRAIRFHEEGLARLEDEWVGTGSRGEEFRDPAHPYADDLDLLGRGSLFERLSRARTRAGEEQLAAWLLHPLRGISSPESGAETIRARQVAVAELRDRLDLREEIALLGERIEGSVDARALPAWGSSPITFPTASRGLSLLAGILGLTTFGSMILWFALGYRTLALAALFAETIFLFLYRQRIGAVNGAADRPCRELRVLAEILARIEREEFRSPVLRRIGATLAIDGEAPSQQIAHLSRWIDLLDSTRNQAFAPFAFLLLVPAQVAFAIDRWKARSGGLIAPWIDAVAEFEALLSLASYAFEHPEDPFPELIDGPVAHYEAWGLGHPLIPRSRSIRNELEIGETVQLLIISGSNMSGKSTMLRTVGINAVLAYAGAPVCARRLRLSQLAIGASLHPQDSLQSGASRFYAEITRLQQVVELTKGPLPVLFLLDEILSGTNSHDRRIGAEAVLRGLLARGAIGLTTTHDLALTRMVEPLGDHARNVHFEDHLEENRMVFDYRMQPGIVTHSNALALMRAVGLEV
jgi:hypothetical protein